MARTSFAAGDPALARRLERELEGEVLFDRFSRGRYSTDASIYQIEPIGVVVPRGPGDVVRAVQIAAESGLPLLPRGAGTSQCGQSVGEALVLDFTKYLANIVALDVAARTVTVEPGVVLDDLNRYLKPHGLFFPVDVSTASRATIGGMAGNNSCGARSIRYGNMMHNVRRIDAVMASGELIEFSEVPGNLASVEAPPPYLELVEAMRTIAADAWLESDERWPKLLRRVGGYNLDSIGPRGHNMARLLVGSEGTLGAFTRIELELQPIPPHKVLGVCHFPTFYAAMDATRHLVNLKPSAVELVDATMIDLARAIPMYAGTIDRFIQGKPAAVLLVEFAGEEHAAQLTKIDELETLTDSLGFPGSVVKAIDPAFQAAVWEVRKAGLNIMMSMKGDGKPVSFIEDCAVSLEDLAEYTDRLTRVFEKHGTTGTWYAHASVGCLHVRPVLNLKDETDVKKMRAIAEEAFAMVREYKGSHSGEHGDGLVRSEFHEPMFGARITRALEKVKDTFDPEGLFNPGKIVRPPRMDDRSLFRFKPGYRTEPLDTALDWSQWSGFAGAVEMCNNNGACRKSVGVMCPSFRATRDEQHLTRGRANSLRLALSGQLGPGALTSDAMFETLDLCVGCKACRRECPTGVDMARMKTEFLYHYRKRHRLSLKDRMIAWLPRYAPRVAPAAALLNLRDRIPGLAAASERLLGLSARRSLPPWRRDYFDPERRHEPAPDGAPTVALFADTFTTWFEPENAHAARAVLEAAGFRVEVPGARGEVRPLCCGRTFLAAGLVDEARSEARRTLAALLPYAQADIPIVGLEPSCLLTFRDELAALLPDEDTTPLAGHTLLLDEFLAREAAAGHLDLPLSPLPQSRALVHGHCHQKSFGLMGDLTATLGLVPGLEVEVIESGCCGMAGAFGYEANHYDVSMRMAELELLPRIRAADENALLVANGTSCRHQIRDGTGRRAMHVAVLLERALAAPRVPREYR